MIAAQHRMRRRDHELEHAPFVGLQIELAIGEDVRLDPLEDAEAAGQLRVEPIDLTVLARDRIHGHPARNRQPVGMVGDAHAGVAERQAGLRHRVDPLAAIAPRRVHLKVAPQVRFRNHARGRRPSERLLHLELAEEMTAQCSQGQHLAAVSRRGDRRIHGFRRPGLDELGDDARARRADERHVAERARLHEIGDRHRQSDDRSRGALVSQLRSLIALQGSHVVQETGRDHVEIRPEPGFRLGLPFSPATAGSGVCSQSHTPAATRRRLSVNNGKKRICEASADRHLPCSDYRQHVTSRDGGGREGAGWRKDQRPARSL